MEVTPKELAIEETLDRFTSDKTQQKMHIPEADSTQMTEEEKENATMESTRNDPLTTSYDVSTSDPAEIHLNNPFEDASGDQPEQENKSENNAAEDRKVEVPHSSSQAENLKQQLENAFEEHETKKHVKDFAMVAVEHLLQTAGDDADKTPNNDADQPIKGRKIGIVRCVLAVAIIVGVILIESFIEKNPQLKFFLGVLCGFVDTWLLFF